MSIILQSSGGGSVTIAEPTTASNFTQTLPAATGTLVLSGTTPSFNGIAFPATQSVSADANTLDDYEEGTFTPTVTAQSGSITSYTSSGRYTKIGNIVRFNVATTITNAGTGSGTMSFTLPFTPTDTNWAASGVEIQSVGFACSVFGTAGASFGLRRYENSTAIGTNYAFVIAGVFQV